MRTASPIQQMRKIWIEEGGSAASFQSDALPWIGDKFEHLAESWEKITNENFDAQSPEFKRKVGGRIIKHFEREILSESGLSPPDAGDMDETHTKGPSKP